ncbi:MAG: hypothetical protein UT36_C0003G0133 [Candidatus Peregrinibacteria bacterium GW2011_GWF2_39_17]|nr:MAG: hypothetical protein UT36_C0003G0133 [Candidatus Peregrinibacteria bacterium GW2011_GWF2_39_17]
MAFGAEQEKSAGGPTQTQKEQIEAKKNQEMLQRAKSIGERVSKLAILLSGQQEKITFDESFPIQSVSVKPFRKNKPQIQIDVLYRDKSHLYIRPNGEDIFLMTESGEILGRVKQGKDSITQDPHSVLQKLEDLEEALQALKTQRETNEVHFETSVALSRVQEEIGETSNFPQQKEHLHTLGFQYGELIDFFSANGQTDFQMTSPDTGNRYRIQIVKTGETKSCRIDLIKNDQSVPASYNSDLALLASRNRVLFNLYFEEKEGGYFLKANPGVRQKEAGLVMSLNTAKGAITLIDNIYKSYYEKGESLRKISRTYEFQFNDLAQEHPYLFERYFTKKGDSYVFQYQSMEEARALLEADEKDVQIVRKIMREVDWRNTKTGVEIIISGEEESQMIRLRGPKTFKFANGDYEMTKKTASGQEIFTQNALNFMDELYGKLPMLETRKKQIFDEKNSSKKGESQTNPEGDTPPPTPENPENPEKDLPDEEPTIDLDNF